MPKPSISATSSFKYVPSIKRVLFCLPFLVFGLSAFTSANTKAVDRILNDTKTSNSDSVVYELNKVDVKPVFEAGMKAWIKHLSSNMKNNRSQGSNTTKWFDLMFIIEKDGSLSNMTVIESGGRSLDAEALRIMRTAPKWIPGQSNGLPVRVLYKMKMSIQTSVGYPGRP